MTMEIMDNNKRSAISRNLLAFADFAQLSFPQLKARILAIVANLPTTHPA